MLRTLVVGLSSADHVTTVHGLAASIREPLFATEPVLGLAVPPTPGLHLVESIEHAATQLDPTETVVHLGAPPRGRLRTLIRLSALGFRRFLMEEPLAGNGAELDGILALRDHYRLDVLVAAPWLCSTLAGKMTEIVRSGRFGGLRRIGADGSPVPHTLALALALAGPADLVDASRTGDATATIRMILRHHSAVSTALRVRAAAPGPACTLALRLDDALLTGRLGPGGQALLRVSGSGTDEQDTFHDDPLRAAVLAAYRHFAGSGPAPGLDPATQAEAVRLLRAARQHRPDPDRQPVPHG
jgi:hypothetical protein